MAYGPFDLKRAAFSNDDSLPARLYFNQASPSAYVRGNTRAVPLALAYMRTLEQRGARVLNGADVFALELSKSAQATLLHTLGIKVEEVKSGPLKAVPSPFEPTDERARAVTEEMVQDAKVWFVDLVSDRRKIAAGSVPGLTDGRIYSGRQAVELNLVDQIGDEKAAMTWLTKERQVPAGLKIVDWKPAQESAGLFGWLFQSLAGAIGLSAERIAGIAGQISATLKLDGLVSVWHPAAN